MSFKTITQTAAISAALLSLAACGGSSSSSSDTGRLTLGLTDGPAKHATSVNIAFTGIEVKKAGEPPMEAVAFDAESCDEFEATGACTINLLNLTGDKRKVVFSEELEPGNYEWIRLLVAAERNVMDSYLTFKTETEGETWCSLFIPSGGSSGLKIFGDITVTANGTSDYTMDFDVNKSIIKPPGLRDPISACAENYLMKPVIRLVDTTEVGSIRGSVPEELLSDPEYDCTKDENTMEYPNAAVYVFEDIDGDAVADDIDGEMDPVTMANVVLDPDPAADGYVYDVGFLLAPEDYLVALTCTAGDEDQPDVDDFPADPADETPFSFIAEQVVTTVVGAVADGSF